jgi:hypothetical protein
MKRLSWGAVGLVFLLGCNPDDRRMDDTPPSMAERRPSSYSSGVATSNPPLLLPTSAPVRVSQPATLPPDIGRGPDLLPPPNFGASTPAPTARLKPIPATPTTTPRPETLTRLPEVPARLPAVHSYETAFASAPNVRMVNGRRLRINYAIKDSGGLTAPVELWYTRDGKTWHQDPAPPQLRSPYVMEVKQEGLYGLLLVAAADGPQAKPQPGDVPDFWVAVDWTRPTVNLLGVEVDAAHRQFHVHWSASDQNLGPRPITISCAPQPNGPWTPVAANLRNTGHYTGPLPNVVGKKVWVMVEAADQVGNIGESRTTNAVGIERVSATVDHRARIVSIDYSEE